MTGGPSVARRIQELWASVNEDFTDVDALHELYPPEGATTPAYHEIVTVGWAQRWPAEDLWVAHLAS